MIKLGAADLRTTKSTEKKRKQIKKNPIYIILDNVMDTYNIGSIFRLADAVSAEKVILCGKQKHRLIQGSKRLLLTQLSGWRGSTQIPQNLQL